MEAATARRGARLSGAAAERESGAGDVGIEPRRWRGWRHWAGRCGRWHRGDGGERDGGAMRRRRRRPRRNLLAADNYARCGVC